MRLTKSLGFAGALIAAALVGGTVIGSALAADEETGDNTGTGSSRAGYCEVFLDTLAADLGVTRESLTAAGRSAANAVIDAAVEGGDLSEQRAEALRERIAAADGSCDWLGGKAFGRGFGHGFGAGMQRGMIRGFVGANLSGDASEVLGLERRELLSALREAGSLEAVAEAQGVPYEQVRAAILASVQARIDAAVADGLPQERADAALERVTAWLDEGGTAGNLGVGRGSGGHRHGPGFGSGWGDED